MKHELHGLKRNANFILRLLKLLCLSKCLIKT